jgi:hypothetical protein
MRLSVLMVGVMLASFAVPAIALEKDVYQEKVAASGELLIIGSVSATNPDCSNTGTVLLRVLKAPTHGTFSNTQTMVFPHFPAANPRSVCNARRVVGEQQTYVSKAGYVGSDSLEFELIFPEGGDQRVHVKVNVK